MWYNFFCKFHETSLWILPKIYDKALCNTPDKVVKEGEETLPYNTLCYSRFGTWWWTWCQSASSVSYAKSHKEHKITVKHLSQNYKEKYLQWFLNFLLYSPNFLYTHPTSSAWLNTSHIMQYHCGVGVLMRVLWCYCDRCYCAYSSCRVPS